MCSLGEDLLARELSLLAPPGEGRGAPVGCVVGSIDLLHRDPETGELVVVDYKTDRVESDEDVAERVKIHASQGEAYARALKDAFGLEELPRFELWFLRLDRIEVVGLG